MLPHSVQYVSFFPFDVNEVPQSQIPAESGASRPHIGQVFIFPYLEGFAEAGSSNFIFCASSIDIA
jgi:hypothetical protein